MDYESVLSQLCSLPGPSGFEAPVAEAAAQLLAPWVDEVSITRMGSVLGVRRCGKENGNDGSTIYAFSKTAGRALRLVTCS